MTKTVGVFFGSRSPEHDVSIVTGQLIISGLRELDVNIVSVYINKKGDWLVGESLGHIETFRQNKVDEEKLDKYELDLKSSGGKLVLSRKGILGKKILIDVVFPAFHGQNGEDGTFQGLCEMLNVPYVGCDTTSSAVAMDKVLTKLLYRAEKIPTTDFIYLEADTWLTDKNRIVREIKKLKMPLMVKPARLGSSIGITKADNMKDLEFAVEVALHYDSKVIVEEAVQNLMDVTCCVIGLSDPTPSLLQESVFQSEFFSYEDKYLKGGGAQTGNATQSIVIPARLNDKVTAEIQKTAVQVFKLFGASGIARVDFLYNKKTGRWFANEVNTLPGTLYHHLWKKSGVPFTELLQKLINWAEEKYLAKKNITYTFESTILNKASSNKLSLKGL